MRISYADADLSKILVEGWNGTVHSRYRSTTNLIDDRGFRCAIINPEQGLAPRALTLERAINHLDETGDKFEVKSGFLNVGNCQFNLGEARFINLDICTQPLNLSAYSQVRDRKPQPKSETTDPFAQAADTLAYHRFETQLLRATTVEEVTTAVEKLIGLGSGLTPTGDDLIAGLLLAAHTPTSQWHRALGILCEAVAENLGQTNPISAGYLRDAAVGKARSSLLEFRINLSNPTDNLCDTLQQVWNLGSSSGPALVQGMLAGLNPYPKGGTHGTAR